MKLASSLSYRVATRLNCLSLLKKRSMDNDLGLVFDEAFAQMAGIIALVGKTCRSREALDKIMGKGDVVTLSGRAYQTDRKAKGFGRRMDLGPQAAARPTQALGIRPLLSGARRPRADAPARWCYRSSAIPDRLRRPAFQHVVQHAHLDPAIVAPLNRSIVAQPLRQVAPSTTGRRGISDYRCAGCACLSCHLAQSL